MTKLCMIGNSHVAAMRLAWDEAGPRHPEVDATIFGAHARKLVTAEVSDTGMMRFEGPPIWTFRAGDEPNRARAIRLNDFDAFAIVGCDFGPISVFRAYKHYHFAGLKGTRRQLLTRDMFIRAVMRNVNESAALILSELIRTRTGKPVLLAPTPLPSENGYLDRDAALMEPYQAALEVGDSGTLMTLYAEVCDRLAACGVAVLAQPEETKASPFATLQRYSDNSIRLRADVDMPHPEDDYFHMNDTYGAIIWEALIAAIVPQTQDAAAP